MDLDHASLEELTKDEVQGYLGQALQLREEDSLEGTLGPLNATKLSNLVYFFPVTFSFLF